MIDPPEIERPPRRRPLSGLTAGSAGMLFVLVGVAVGYRAGTHWTNPNLDNLPAIGAVAGALIAYVTGGWLGRALRRLTGTVSGSVSHIPPYEILAEIG